MDYQLWWWWVSLSFSIYCILTMCQTCAWHLTFIISFIPYRTLWSRVGSILEINSLRAFTGHTDHNRALFWIHLILAWFCLSAVQTLEWSTSFNMFLKGSLYSYACIVLGKKQCSSWVVDCLMLWFSMCLSCSVCRQKCNTDKWVYHRGLLQPEHVWSHPWEHSNLWRRLPSSSADWTATGTRTSLVGTVLSRAANFPQITHKCFNGAANLLLKKQMINNKASE